MSLFSFLRKNKQESVSKDAPFVSRAEGESNARRSRGSRKQANAAEVKDPALPEKKRARRRLIGAVALVLAAVIGLPMILDSEPKPVADDIAIRIPSKDKPTPLNSAPQPVVPASVVPPAAGLDPNEEVVESPEEKAPPAAVAPPPAADRSQVAAPSPKVSAPEKPHVPAAVSAHDKAESKSTPKADKTDDSARALALLEGKTDPKAEKKTGKFVIQIAALASKEKVTELQSKLKDAGIKSYTQKVATANGERIRIRVGPFASKDEADKAKAKISKLGLSGTLVPA